MTQPASIIVCSGAESSGKSTLAAQLRAHLQVPLVNEVAREYLQPGAAYLPSDLLNIAARQAADERLATRDGGLVVCDTDLQVLYIWWQEKFGPVPQSLAHAYAQQLPREYLLCAPDLPWQQDPLRENPDDRQRLFALYQQDLQQRGLSYHVISGHGEQRLQQALTVLASLQLC